MSAINKIKHIVAGLKPDVEKDEPVILDQIAPAPAPQDSKPFSPAPVEVRDEPPVELEAAPMPAEEPIAATMTPPRTLGPQKRTDNLTNIREDLAKLNQDMSSGEQFYAQSLKRISNLIDYAYETEASLATLEHLEPENARLKEELGRSRETLTELTARAETFKAKAEAYEGRYIDTRQKLEQTELNLDKIKDEKGNLERAIAERDVEISGLKNSNRTISNKLSIDQQNNGKLSEKLVALSSSLSLAQTEKLHAEKRLAELKTRYDHLAAQKDEYEALMAQSRAAHRAAEESNIELRANLESVLADVQMYKQQQNSADRSKDSELNRLRAKTADLEAELSINRDLSVHSQAEMNELREQTEQALRGRRNLLDHIENQKSEIDNMRAEIAALKQQSEGLRGEIINQQSENEELRRVNIAQSDKLKRYIRLNAEPVNAPPATPQRRGSFSAVTAEPKPSAPAAPTTVSLTSTLDITPPMESLPVETVAPAEAHEPAVEESAQVQDMLSRFHEIDLIGKAQ